MKNPYLSFLLKVLLFVAVFVAIDYLIGLGFSSLRNKAFSKNEFSRELSYQYCIEKAKPEIAIIGSSTATHHFIPKQMEDSLGLSCYNFGRDGCFLVYQCGLINLMLDRYKPKIIIWEIGETGLSSWHNKDKEYRSLDEFYPWYSNNYIRNLINGKDCFQKYRMYINSYKNNSKLLLLFRLCMGDFNQREKGYVALKEGKFDSFGRHKNFSNFLIENYKVDILERTLDRCEKERVCVVFSSSPQFFDDEVKSCDYSIRLKEIAQKRSIPYLDYYNAQPFNSDSTLFKDNYHLNNKGAVFFMERFIESIREEVDLSSY